MDLCRWYGIVQSRLNPVQDSGETSIWPPMNASEQNSIILNRIVVYFKAKTQNKTSATLSDWFLLNLGGDTGPADSVGVNCRGCTPYQSPMSTRN